MSHDQNSVNIICLGQIKASVYLTRSVSTNERSVFMSLWSPVSVMVAKVEVELWYAFPGAIPGLGSAHGKTVRTVKTVRVYSG